MQDASICRHLPVIYSATVLSLSSLALTMLGAASGAAASGLSTKPRMSCLFHTG